MAATHLIHTNRHGQHPSFQKVYDPLKKVVLNVLFSNEFTTRSGIFSMKSGELSDRVHCAALDKQGNVIKDEYGCIEIINANDIKKVVIKLDKEDGVLWYDPLSHIVYLKDFLLAVPFGLSASIISTEICKEYKNFFIKEYWDDFFRNYGKYILDYIESSEKEAEKRSWKKINSPEGKKNNLKIEDFKDQITTPDMEVLKGLIKMHGYDKEKITLIKTYKSSIDLNP